MGTGESGVSGQARGRFFRPLSNGGGMWERGNATGRIWTLPSPSFPLSVPPQSEQLENRICEKTGGNAELRVMKPFLRPYPSFDLLFPLRPSPIPHHTPPELARTKKREGFPLFSQPFPISPFFFSLFLFPFPPSPLELWGQFGLLLPLLFFPRVNPGLIRISPLRCPALLPSSSLSIFMPPSSSHPPPLPLRHVCCQHFPRGLNGKKDAK